MIFDAYKAIQGTTENKKLWHEANAKGDEQSKKKANEAANMYRKLLADNGYGDIADALSKVDVSGAEAILKSFVKNNSAPVDTVKATTPTKTDTSAITGIINDLYGIQKSDRETMAKKYDTLEDYNYNHDHYESKIGKSIMDNYKFQGDTASNNAVASGGAFNGGNIDSYAAANANRQQLAFTNAGNQAILNDFNARINNARGILNDLGVYQQNQDKGMQTTIGIQQSEEQRVFENEETKKNNDVSRKATISEVTGYVPAEWANTGNFYLDENGKLKPEYENIDFSAIMAEAKKNGNTELYNQASVARAAKIYGNYEKYGKYDDGNYTLTGKQQTEAGRQFDKNAELTEKEINTTADLTREEIEANERMNQLDNSTKVTITDKEIASAEKLSQVEEDETWQDALKGYDLSDNAKTFLGVFGYDAWKNSTPENPVKINIEKLLTADLVDKDGKPLGTTNKDKYKITALDPVELARLYGVDTAWVDNYTWYEKGNDGEWNPTE